MKKTMLKMLCLSALTVSVFGVKTMPAFADVDVSGIDTQISALQDELNTLNSQIEEKQKDLDNTNSEIEKRDKAIEKVDTQLENTEERKSKDIEELANQLSTKIIESQTTSLISGDNKLSKITLHPLSFSLLQQNDTNKLGQVALENITLEETKADIIEEKRVLDMEKQEKVSANDTLLTKKSEIESNIQRLENEKNRLIEEDRRKREEEERRQRILNKYGINVSGTNSDILETAFQFLGLKYVWGGTSPIYGFDCSGFTQYVYAQHGIYLPRTTYDQINCGTAVRNRSDLQPGDLIFPHIGHVQIYIGNGKVIHAPQTGDVIKISNLGSYISARRLR